MDVHFNVSNIHFTEFSIDPNTPIIRLQENKAAFEITNLTMRIQSDYEFISDPPLLADIGIAFINVERTSVFVEFETYLTDTKQLQVYISQFLMNFTNPGPLVDLVGFNDIGIIVNSTVNTALNVVRNRVASILAESKFFN